MRDRGPTVEELARKALRGAVLLEETISLGDSTLSIWCRSDVLPPRRVAIIEAGDALFVTTQSLSSFERMLRLVRPELSDVALISRLVSKAAPPNRLPLVDPHDPNILPKYQAVWRAPLVHGGALTLFCNDFRKGRFERIRIGPDYRVDVEVIGPSKKAGLR